MSVDVVGFNATVQLTKRNRLLETTINRFIDIRRTTVVFQIGITSTSDANVFFELAELASGLSTSDPPTDSVSSCCCYDRPPSTSIDSTPLLWWCACVKSFAHPVGEAGECH